MGWFLFYYRLTWVYAYANLILAIFSFNILFLLIVAILHRRPNKHQTVRTPGGLPAVLVQLPVYNEQYVVERLIDSAAALDYPRDRLVVQVLDDSTDVTSALAEARVNYHRERGLNIQYIHRRVREGFKAGALAYGLDRSPGDLVAIFDADFIPPPDYLQKMAPDFAANPRLGILQARWEHLNIDHNLTSHVIALGLDLHFAVDQVARSGSGMLMNCNGSGCMLRRDCITDAGGWQTDTLVEDTDLSYRAQLKSWKIDYRPDISVPGELPTTMTAFKQQQFRWSKGIIQTLKKLAWPILSSRRPLIHKLEGLLHLSTYLASPLMLLTFLLTLPVVILHGFIPLDLTFLGIAALVPPLAILYAQIQLRPNWLRLAIYYPLLFLVSIGLSVTITSAVWQALIGKKSPFVRTPKFSNHDPSASHYGVPVDGTTWLELCLCLYGAGTTLLALDRAPSIAPYILAYTVGYGFTAWLSLHQAAAAQRLIQSNQYA